MSDIEVIQQYLHANPPHCAVCDKPVQLVQRPEHLVDQAGYEMNVVCHGLTETLIIGYGEASRLFRHYDGPKQTFECFKAKP